MLQILLIAGIPVGLMCLALLLVKFGFDRLEARVTSKQNGRKRPVQKTL